MSGALLLESLRFCEAVQAAAAFLGRINEPAAAQFVGALSDELAAREVVDGLPNRLRAELKRQHAQFQRFMQ